MEDTTRFWLRIVFAGVSFIGGLMNFLRDAAGEMLRRFYPALQNDQVERIGILVFIAGVILTFVVTAIDELLKGRNDPVLNIVDVKTHQKPVMENIPRIK